MVKNFLLFLFALPALSPLFALAPTRSADGLLHLYRLVELDALWRQGSFFSRWFPDLVYGYGLPLLNYYAPLVYYLALPLHLVGIPFTLTLNLATGAAMFVGAVGMFNFARELFINFYETSTVQRPPSPNLAALVSALAFLYAPYLLFNALQRANLAEQWALAFTPLALWRFLLLARTPNALNWCAAVLSFAAVLLSHNVTGFLFAPLLLGWIVALVASRRSQEARVRRQFPNRVRAAGGSSRTEFGRQAAGSAFYGSCFTFDASLVSRLVSRSSSIGARLCLRHVSSFMLLLSSFTVALLLTCFFLLPAFLERDYVQIARVIVTPDFDYRYNFVSPAEIVALLPRADTGRMNPSFPATLGVVQVILSLGSTIALCLFARRRAALPLFYLVVAAVCSTGLMFAASQPIWDAVPLLAFVQLPMRLRGIVALLLATLAGWAILALPARVRIIFAVVAILALALTAFPMLYPRYAGDVLPNPALLDMFAYEKRVGAIGTTSFGEYLPVWVQDVPDASPMEQAYARNEQPSRFVVPPGVANCGEQLAPLKQSLCADAPVAWRILFNAFYFPGWRVTINNAPVVARPNARDGLITFDAPAGKSEITVEYGETSLETIANGLSAFAALVVLAVFALGIRARHIAKGRLQMAGSEPPTRESSGRLANRDSRSVVIVLTLLAIGLCAYKFSYTDRFDSPFTARFDGARVEGVQQANGTRFGNELILLGLDLSSREVKRGDTLTLTLYWRATRPLEKDWSTFAHLTAPDGFVLAQDDNLHPANLPTTRWETDAYAADSHSFVVPNELTPGDYQLRVGVYDPATNTRLTMESGADYLLLATIHVESARQ